MKEGGDKAVVNGLRLEAIESQDRGEDRAGGGEKSCPRRFYAGFGPTLAAECPSQKHDIEASKETVRQGMMRGKLWRGKQEKVKQVHPWRPRRCRVRTLGGNA